MSLTATEWRLVALLVRNPGRLLTHAYILEQVWGTKDWKTNSIGVYMAATRRKLEPDPAHPRYFTTEPASGLRFVPRASSAPDDRNGMAG